MKYNLLIASLLVGCMCEANAYVFGRTYFRPYNYNLAGSYAYPGYAAAPVAAAAHVAAPAPVAAASYASAPAAVSAPYVAEPARAPAVVPRFPEPIPAVPYANEAPARVAPAPVAPLAPAPLAVAPLTPTTSSQYQAQDEFGKFAYGYQNINSAKHEEADGYGGVVGSYTYRDEAGTHTVNYVADDYGFRLV